LAGNTPGARFHAE
jgi:hypothetical protein